MSASRYVLDLVDLAVVYGLGALGLSICVGHAGQLSMAQAASFAVGAYGYAVLGVRYALPGWSALAGAAVGAAALAAVSCLVARHLEDDEFIFGTLALGAVIEGLLRESRFGEEGATAITGVPPLVGRTAGAVSWSAAAGTLLVAAALVAAVHAALRSPWGRLLRGIRDAPALALSLGKRVRVERGWAAAAASLVGSMAGALLAAHEGYVDPSLAATDYAVVLLACVLLGGADRLWGPPLGAVAVVLLPELARLLRVQDATVAQLRQVAVAAALLLLLHLRPAGLLGGRAAGSGGSGGRAVG